MCCWVHYSRDTFVLLVLGNQRCNLGMTWGNVCSAYLGTEGADGESRLCFGHRFERESLNGNHKDSSSQRYLVVSAGQAKEKSRGRPNCCEPYWRQQNLSWMHTSTTLFVSFRNIEITTPCSDMSIFLMPRRSTCRVPGLCLHPTTAPPTQGHRHVAAQGFGLGWDHTLCEKS